MARFLTGFLVLILFGGPLAAGGDASWHGILQGSDNRPVSDATIVLHSPSARYSAMTASAGVFDFKNISPGIYDLSITAKGITYKSAVRLAIEQSTSLTATVQLSEQGNAVHLIQESTSRQASGGEHLSSSEVSSLPLNSRDFS